MPMRFGEMVLVIRTQDYASRNLNRLSQNLGKLSKLQQLQRQQQSQLARQSDLLARKDTIQTDIRNLQRRFDLERRINQTMRDRRAMSAGMRKMERMQVAPGLLRGGAGQFTSMLPFMSDAKAGMKQLEEEEGKLRRQHTRLLNEIRQTSPALARLGTEAAQARLSRLERTLEGVSGRLRIVSNDLTVTGNALDQIKWHKIHEAGQMMSRFGRVMQLTGLVATGSFIAAGNAAANFGQGVALAATQARDVDGDFQQVALRSEQLQGAITEMMTRFPASAEEMSNAAYEIFSSLDLAQDGVTNFGRGINVLELVNKAAVAGMTSLDDSMRGIIITFNNFAESGKDGVISVQAINRILDDMFNIIRFGDIHMAELAQMMERVAPAAKGVGHSLRQISGPIATLTKLIGPGKTAAGFALLEQSFANRDFVEGMRDMGVEIKESSGHLIPFVDIIDKIVAAVPGLATGQVTVEEFFKTVTAAGRLARTGRVTEGQQFTIQARTAARALFQNLDMVHEAQNNIINNKQEFDQALKAMMNTPAVQWKIFLNSLKAVALEIGADVLPALLGLAGWVKTLIDRWKALDPEVRKNIIRFTFFAGVAALIGGILFSVVGGIVSVIGAIALLTGSLGGAGGAGVIGRMITLLGLLRALTLVGVITITIKVLMDWSGASEKIQQFQKWAQGKTDDIPGLGQVTDLLAGIDKAMGLAPEDKPKMFKPGERMFPGTKDMRTWGDAFPGLAKKMKESGSGAIDFAAIVKNSTKEVRNALAGELGVKSLEDLQNSLIEAGKTGDEWSKGYRQAISSATEQAQQSIDQAAANMTNTWMQFRDQNAQMFGELFSGPFFQSETWSLAEEWDVKPSMKEINRDLREQIAQFKKYRGTLTAIGKRKGATPELMKELSALGPGAMKFLEVLRKGAPGAWNQFIKLWRTKQSEIDKATKIDFDKQLAQWFKYGKGIAQQIILGLRSENVALDNAFKQYITNKFPNIVKEAQAKAAAEYKKQNPRPPQPGGPGAGPGGNNNNSNNNNANVTVIVYPREGETTLHALKRGAWEYAHRGSISGHGEHKGPPPKGSKVIRKEQDNKGFGGREGGGR